MIDPHGTELDEMIAAEKKQVAFEYHSEAWADGISDGIEAEILAETAIATALTELVRRHGEAEVLELMDNLRVRIEHGEFRGDRNLQ
ncbi:FHIPEP family type III secretion protein [Aureimonas fodinaquatilis]|uniref:FHIPEP family type III secretion protein n=1 Tax=Aureimonas fodinaquatilis TaxID=2565783 RepID=A0A5B0DW92_9HYPH|nr:FHIPEP family type III secretion protein [Aureimonas fodinaquatilis]KAA0971024.1 FHIPEP family type III secretion protein [Aureimonas fodinaquatilis]